MWATWEENPHCGIVFTPFMKSTTSFDAMVLRIQSCTSCWGVVIGGPSGACVNGGRCARGWLHDGMCVLAGWSQSLMAEPWECLMAEPWECKGQPWSSHGGAMRQGSLMAS